MDVSAIQSMICNDQGTLCDQLSMPLKLTSGKRIPQSWPKNLDLFMRWAAHLGSRDALELCVGDLHSLSEAKPGHVGVATQWSDVDEPPLRVRYVPLWIYEKTIASLLVRGPHGNGDLLHDALGIHFDTRVEFLCMVKGFFVEPDGRSITENQNMARLRQWEF